MIIFTFKSRSQALRFFNMLKSTGIECKLLNTPSGVHVGCGLSVQINEANLKKTKEVFFSTSFDSFAGLFSLIRENGVFVAQRLSL